MVPLSDISSFPGLSRYAPVKLPLTWPNSSDSRSVSGIPAQLTGSERLAGARTGQVDGASDDFLARAAFSCNQDLGVGTRNALHLGLEVADGATRPNELRVPVLPHRSPTSPSPTNPKRAHTRLSSTRAPLVQTSHRFGGMAGRKRSATAMCLLRRQLTGFRAFRRPGWLETRWGFGRRTPVEQSLARD